MKSMAQPKKPITLPSGQLKADYKTEIIPMVQDVAKKPERGVRKKLLTEKNYF